MYLKKFIYKTINEAVIYKNRLRQDIKEEPGFEKSKRSKVKDELHFNFDLVNRVDYMPWDKEEQSILKKKNPNEAKSWNKIHFHRNLTDFTYKPDHRNINLTKANIWPWKRELKQPELKQVNRKHTNTIPNTILILNKTGVSSDIYNALKSDLIQFQRDEENRIALNEISTRILKYSNSISTQKIESWTMKAKTRPLYTKTSLVKRPKKKKIINLSTILPKVIDFDIILKVWSAVAFPLVLPNPNTTMKPDENSLLVKIIDHDKNEPAHENEEYRGIKPLKVLCMVTTYPANHIKKAIHVKNTWGKRCDTLLFMSTEEEPALPTIKLAINSTSRQYLWPKARAANRYLYEHYLNSADWFLKADDDTYVIVENLRKFLSKYNTDEAIYFGLKVTENGQVYINGGAGYVLSREALFRLVTFGDLTPDKDYDELGSDEDVKIARLLDRVGARAIDTRDNLLRQRFNMYPPQDLIFPDKSNYFWSHNDDPKFEGLDGCSDSVVSFHYIRPKDMYALEYLIYHLRPYNTMTSMKTTFH